MAPSLHVDVESATLGSISTVLGAGSVRLSNTSATSISLRANTGSVYVHDLPSAGTSVEVNYRQPSHRLCVASDYAGSTSFAEGSPMEGIGCDLSDVSRQGPKPCPTERPP